VFFISAGVNTAWADVPGPAVVAAEESHLSHIEGLLGPDHPQVALVLAQLGTSSALNNPRLAEEYYRRALAILSEAEAKNHPLSNPAGLVAVRKRYAAFLRAQERTWEAVTEESRVAADEQELDWQRTTQHGPVLFERERLNPFVRPLR
jgi:hypothetical protein